MIRVQLESPYAVPMSKGDRQRFPDLADRWQVVHLNYRDAAIRDSIMRCEAPFASHAMYTTALSDHVQAERALGTGAGLAYLRLAERHVFYLDLIVHETESYGEDYRRWSKGMKLAREVGDELGITTHTRRISEDWTKLSLDLFRELRSLRGEHTT